MKCTSPIKIKHPTGTWMKIACGHCIACRITKASQWALRCLLEQTEWKESSFVTLTYNDENIPRDLSVSKRELVLMIKRFRKNLKGRKIKYFACGEYGELKGRCHFHMIIFGYYPKLEDIALSRVMKGELYEAWTDDEGKPKGIIYVGTATMQSMRYIAKYMLKEVDWYMKGLKRPFILMSQELGVKFAEKNAEQLKENLNITFRGVPYGLTKYLMEKLDIDFHEVMVKMMESPEYKKRKKERMSLADRTKKNRVENEQRDTNLKGKIKLYGKNKNSL